MKIARIVSSNSHIDYVARVVDSLDASFPPSAEDFGFGQFVKLPFADETEIVGVIYDSMLVKVTARASLGRRSATTATISGMTSPARRTITVSPIRTSLRSTSSML